MKVRLIHIFLFLLIADFILSLPQVEANFNQYRPGGFELVRVLRLCAIPILSVLFIQKLRARKWSSLGWSFWIEMVFPIIVFYLILFIQLYTIPQGAVQGHINSGVTFVFRNLLYLCLILNLNLKASEKLVKFIPLLFLGTLIVAVYQYPLNILTGEIGLGDVLSALGQGSKIKTFGLFMSANEDGNALVALFPFALFYIEKLPVSKKIFVRNFALVTMALVLLFNGTRTAMFASFPMVLFLFYSNLSIKRVLGYLPIVGPLLFLVVLLVSDFVGAAFSRDTAGEGSFNWRREVVWTPAIEYINQHSPILGFGSRGWDFVARVLDINRGGRGPFTAIPSHNLYIWLYACFGLIGLAILALILFGLIRNSFRLAKNPNRDIALLAKACFCSVCAYIIWGGISNAFFPPGWNILYGIALIVASLRMMENWLKVDSSRNFNPYLNKYKYSEIQEATGGNQETANIS